MSLKEMLDEVRHPTLLGIGTWQIFYSETYSEATKWKLHYEFGCKLDILARNLKSGTRESKKVLALKRQLKVSAFKDVGALLAVKNVFSLRQKIGIGKKMMGKIVILTEKLIHKADRSRVFHK